MSLSKLSNIKSNKEELNLSNVYNIYKGVSGFADIGVRTYFASATVGRLKQDLETFEKLTKDKSWPVSQIIQRELDRERIRRITTQYLLKEGNIKYFPPIIVAIIPRNENFGISDDYTYKEINNDERYRVYKNSDFGNDENAEEIFNNANSLSSVDGFYVLKINEAIDFGILAWDKSKHYAVVIDGQHRLESLKLGADKDNDYNNYKQDVLFIDVSEIIKKKKLTPVESVRRIFIDINYTAVPVNQVRKCLMDDKDLASLFVQALVNDDDPNDNRNGLYLIPQVVDWHSENLKHQLPHITGVLVLYQLMADVVLNKSNIISLSDSMKKSKVKRWVNRLNSLLDVDGRISKERDFSDIVSLKKSFKEYQEEEVMQNIDKDENEDSDLSIFNYDYRILDVARQSFEEYYCEPIVYFFQNFQPYKKIISILEDSGAFNKKMILSSLLVTNPSKYEDTHKQSISELKKVLEEKLEDNYYIILTVLGQKTIFEIFFKKLENSIQGDVDKEKILRNSKKIVSDLNQVFKLFEQNTGYSIFGKKHANSIPPDIRDYFKITKFGILGSNFWEEVIYRNNSIIYNSQGVKALKAVILFIIEYITAKNEGEDTSNLKIKFEKFQENKIIKRREDDGSSDNVAINEMASILNAKTTFLKKYIDEIMN